MRRRCVLVLAVFAVLLAGCSGSKLTTSTSSSPPSPSTATSEASPVSSSQTPVSTEDISYSQAEHIAWELARIDREYIYAGKYNIYPREEIAKYAMEPYLSGLEKQYEQYRRDNTKVENVDMIRRSFKPLPGDHSYGAEVALEACLDLSHLKVFERGTLAPANGIYRERYFYKHDGAVLKLFRISAEEVAQCDFS